MRSLEAERWSQIERRSCDKSPFATSIPRAARGRDAGARRRRPDSPTVSTCHPPFVAGHGDDLAKRPLAARPAFSRAGPAIGPGRGSIPGRRRKSRTPAMASMIAPRFPTHRPRHVGGRNAAATMVSGDPIAASSLNVFSSRRSGVISTSARCGRRLRTASTAWRKSLTDLDDWPIAADAQHAAAISSRSFGPVRNQDATEQ